MSIITTESEKSSSGSNSLVYALKERAPRIAMGIAAGQAAWPLIAKGRKWVKGRSTYTITVDGSDEIYDDLHDWLLDRLPSVDRRSLFAYSEGKNNKSGGYGRDATIGELLSTQERKPKPTPKVRLRYDGSRTQTVKLGPHKVKIEVTEGENARDNGTFYVIKPPKVTLTVSSAPARDAVHEHLSELLRLRHQDKFVPSLRLGRPWGEWYRQDELPLRSLESVVLPVEQQDRLVDDMGRFLASEADYARRYIPWHRGYLFSGPPGTGKTSVAKALANHFGMDIYYLPLGDVRSGSTLMDLVGKVQPRSLLLIEDIDVFHAATVRDDNAEVSLSDLLSALDGIATPWGLVSILTTNREEVLDPAMIRPGRIDVVEHFGLASTRQIKGLMRWFYPEWNGADDLGGGKMLAPADIVGAMHRNLDDPDAALKEIWEMRH